MSNAAWTSITDVHETQDHNTITSWLKSLFQTIAEEGTDILKHVGKLLGWYEQIKVADDPKIQITDMLFKSIITNSYPLLGISSPKLMSIVILGYQKSIMKHVSHLQN